jgi:hypothetical protein
MRLFRSTISSGIRTDDPTVILALGLFWLVSLLRVAWVFLRHEVFGAEETLASAVVVGFPWLLLRRPTSRAKAREFEARARA